MRTAGLFPMLLAVAAMSVPAAAQIKPAALAPGDIIAAAPAAAWVDIPHDDLLVMTLAPGAGGKPRRVVIQLMPAPFSRGWVGNIKALAKAHWFDGTAVVRVQDNYVTQWGDPNGEDKVKAKKLPAGLAQMTEDQYEVVADDKQLAASLGRQAVEDAADRAAAAAAPAGSEEARLRGDIYAPRVLFHAGWPLGADAKGEHAWPLHCYGAVGVGRNLSPDTGTGAELYTVIGHAPRHLDRNIAVVGRVIDGMEHLSSLPRGTGALGVYERAAERVPILSVRLASDLPAPRRPAFQYLDTAGGSFSRYAEARASRRDAFFIRPVGGADICNIPVPIRRRP